MPKINVQESPDDDKNTLHAYMATLPIIVNSEYTTVANDAPCLGPAVSTKFSIISIRFPDL